MPKRYSELKKAMRRAHFENGDIADVIGRSNAYVSSRLNGHAEWELGDCYKIMRVLEIPADKIYAVFPPDGMYTTSTDDTKKEKWMRDFYAMLEAGQEYLPQRAV